MEYRSVYNIFGKQYYNELYYKMNVILFRTIFTCNGLTSFLWHIRFLKILQSKLD